MCLAIPMRVRNIEGNRAVLESMGVIAEADVSLVEPVHPGDYLLIHAGFALTKLDPVEAEETLAVWREVRELSDANDSGA